MRKWEGFTKGINLGGWLSQCVHTKEHYDTFISESDFERIASWGVDHIRIPFDYVLVETPDGSMIEDGYRYLDNAMAWGAKYNLRIILDLHKTAGYDFSVFDDVDLEKFFFDNALQERFYHLWDTISSRYAKYAGSVAFELLNEVVSDKVIDSWNRIALQAVRTIRRNAPDVPILIGGIWYNSVLSVAHLDAPYDKNIVYNFHCYEPFIFTHQAASWVPGMPRDLQVEYPEPLKKYKELTAAFKEEFAESLFVVGDACIGTDFFEKLFAGAIRKAEANDVPLYCGEYGVIDKASPESTANFYRDIHLVFEKYDIGRAAWTYKKMDFGITDARLTSVFEKICQDL